MSILSTFIMPQPNDVSVTYLSSILGQPFIDGVMGLTPSGGPTVFSNMMNTFNHLLLGGGLVIFAILLFVGTMNTAADGQFLGRQWHSVWTPMRLIFGVLLVVPLNTGYCIGQYIILYAIMIGINFATIVWQSAIQDIFNNQETPPVPTYLTSEIQQAIGEELTTVSVPMILNAVGLGKNGAGNNIVVIPVNDIYTAGNGTVPSSLAAAIAQNATYVPNSSTGPNSSTSSSGLGSATSSGLCNYLYSSLAQGGQSSPCGQAVMSAITSAGVMGNPVSYGGANIEVNIGSNVPNDITADSFAMGMPANPWTALNNQSAPNGSIAVYGEYVYDPQELVPVVPPSSAPSPSNGGSGGQPILGPGGTHSNLGPGGIESGAVQAYDQVLNILQNAVIAPAQGVSGGGSWNNLLGICSTQIPDPNNPGSNINPCDLQPAVQDILTYAQLVAKQNALALAEQGSANAGAKGSPTPQGGFTPPSTVPPNGTNAAAVNNMYICQDAMGQPAICYNLNDYWIPDINSNTYIDLQLNNSWWMAGASYLVLDNVLAQNLAWMAQAVQQQLQQLSGATNVNPSPNLNYNCGSNLANSTFDTNPQDLTNFMTPEFCVNYNLQVMEMNPNLTASSSGAYSQPGNSYTGVCEVYPFYPDPTYSTSQPNPPALSPFGASNNVNYYSCTMDQVRATDPISIIGKYTQGNVAVSDWMSYIQVYNPNNPQVPNHVDISSNPGFYEQLAALPSNFQGPFAVMLQLASSQSTGSINYAAALFPYLSGVLNVMQYEGLLSGGNSVESILPVNHALTSIFTQLVGGGSGVGSAATAQAAATGLYTVMQQVYNLGITNNSEGVVANQFSLIQQAQAAGISMIMACISSMETVYNNYTTAIEGMVNQVSSVASQAGDTAVILSSVGGVLGALGNIFNAVNTADVQQAQLAIATTTVTTLSNIAIQLMWLPLLLFVVTSLFTAGVQFAIFVPLMPYILFWAGQIAWLLGVIEAIVAAPLVMLGLAHPGGNEILGHSTPAVKLLIGVMFRPVLMVVGMIVGILLTYIVISFSAQGFHTVAAGILNAVPQADQVAQGTLACLLLFIYASFLVMAFQKCFSAIYIIPERVVEWIGGMAQRAGEQELQQVGSTSQQLASGAAQAGGDALNKGLQAQQSKGQQMSDLAGKRMQTQADIAKGYSQAVQQTEQEAAQVVKLFM